MNNQTKIYKTSQSLAVGNFIHAQPEKTLAPRPPAGFVETLRKQGIKVRARHYRWVVQEGMAIEPVLARISKHERKALAADLEKPYPPTILQNGGETHVTVTMPDGRETEDEAICSDKDLYNKRVGVYLATKRALAILKRQIAK